MRIHAAEDEKFTVRFAFKLKSLLSKIPEKPLQHCISFDEPNLHLYISQWKNMPGLNAESFTQKIRNSILPLGGFGYEKEAEKNLNKKLCW